MGRRDDFLNKIKIRDELNRQSNHDFIDAVVPVAEIYVAEQIRKTFDDDSIKNLANSIKNEGLLNPVILHELSEDEYIYENGNIKKFRLVAGERRLRAIQMLGQGGIKARVKKFNNTRKIIITQIIENIQREDLSSYEKALGFYEILRAQWFDEAKVAPMVLIDKCLVQLNNIGKDDYPSSNDLAEDGIDNLGLSLRTVLQYLKLLSYPEQVLDIIKEGSKIGPRIAEDFYPYRNEPIIPSVFLKYEKGDLDSKGMQQILSKLRETNKAKSEYPKEVRIYQKMKTISKQLDSFLDRNLKYRDKEKVLEEILTVESKIEELKKRLL
ncbi:MAG TPA: hypothetical protein DCM31_00235 [Deferribacteraceae bacterium]|nr:hypothetical protein [Deferribacteraceae bacterium]